jgi:hypothetical protein
MWDRVDSLLEKAPDEEALRLHRVELLELRRRRANGLDLGRLIGDEGKAVIGDLVAIPLLTRVREAWDGPLVLHKGAELALDYPGPCLRPFCDLDLLTDDAAGAEAALLAAGFEEVRDERYLGIPHHRWPLQWPGLPLTVEVHSGPNWVDGIPAPTTDELIASAVPSRLGVDGVARLAPAHHALVVAVHAWSHQPLGRLGNLIDVAVALLRADESEVAAVARRWGCSRMWRTTRAAVAAVLEESGRSAAVALWARHLRGVREPTVFEWHIKSVLAPVWGLPGTRVPAAVAKQARATVGPEAGEPWRSKLRRAGLALRNAGTVRSEHILALDARGIKTTQGRN